jgi:hypothetical protein
MYHVVVGMHIKWGSKNWQIVSAILIIIIFGYGTYVVIQDIFAGHPIWWYNGSLILFALAILGLLLLVREGKTALSNIAKYGMHPSSKKSSIDDEAYIPSGISNEYEDSLEDKE